MAAIFPALTAATGAGAAAGGTIFAASAGAKALTLSKVISIGSALSSIAQGFAQSRALKEEAAFERAAAEKELARGASEGRSLSEEYLQLRGEQRVAQLASGLDIASGTAAAVGEREGRKADVNLETIYQNARDRAAVRRARARGLMSQAKGAMLGGIVGAGGTILDSYQLTG